MISSTPDHCFFAARGSDDLIEMLKHHDQALEWEEPEMPPKLIEAAKRLPAPLKHLEHRNAS